MCTDIILRCCEQMYLKKDERDDDCVNGTYMRIYRESYVKMIKRRAIPLNRKLIYTAFKICPMSAVWAEKFLLSENNGTRTAGKGDVVQMVDAKKTRLLVCFIHTRIGGAMTSLINFLNALDTDKYDVDVMFYENDSGHRYGIKETINILPQGKIHKSRSVSNLIRKALSPSYVIARTRYRYYKMIGNKKKPCRLCQSRAANIRESLIKNTMRR